MTRRQQMREHHQAWGREYFARRDAKMALYAIEQGYLADYDGSQKARYTAIAARCGTLELHGCECGCDMGALT